MKRTSMLLAAVAAVCMMVPRAEAFITLTQNSSQVTQLIPGSGPHGTYDDGWSCYCYDDHIELNLSDGFGDPHFTLTGTETVPVRIVVHESCNITLENLHIVSDVEGLVSCGGKLIVHGDNSITAGSGCAGIVVQSGCTLNFHDGGTLTVTGGSGAAGIGGDASGSNRPSVYVNAGNVVFNDCKVIATGGASGVGAGSGGTMGSITVNNATLAATATGTGGAAIGGYGANACGDITINSGTVSALGGSVGIGSPSANPAPDVVINGSTVYAKNGVRAESVKNVNGATLYPVELTGFTAAGAVDLSGFPSWFTTAKAQVYATGSSTYGTCVWLPAGSYNRLIAGEKIFNVTIAANGDTVTTYLNYNFVVNGKDVAFGSGTGWTLDESGAVPVVVLTGSTAMEIRTGQLQNGPVAVVVNGNNPVTFNGVALDYSATNVCPVSVAAGRSPSFTFTGANTMKGGAGCPAISVAATSTLSFAGPGSLAATGGSGAVAQKFTAGEKKWTVAKQQKKLGDADPNPIGLKLTYTAKTGMVKGSYTETDAATGKKVKYTVNGAVVNGRLCGAAFAKGQPPVKATAE